MFIPKLKLLLSRLMQKGQMNLGLHGFLQLTNFIEDNLESEPGYDLE
jgi:hypothetical protein